MTSYRQVVGTALEALRIDGPTSYSWCGVPAPPLPDELAERIGAEAGRAFLRDRLRDRLYESFYCPGRAVPARAGRVVAPGASSFIDSLSRANRGTGSLQAGWIVVRAEADGRLVVRRGGLDLWVRPAEVQGPVVPGGEVSVRMPPELLRLSPGFYMALGDEDLHEDEPVVRHYWHLSPRGGEALVAAGTRFFNEAGLRFRLKVLIDPGLYTRRDSGLLFTPRRRRAEVAALLPALRTAVAEHLRPGTPALTKPLGEGVAVAEDPPDGASFGMDRCGLLAEAVVRAFELGREGPQERLAAVDEAFARRGISFARPYLNPGSTDDYEPVA